MDRGGGRRRRGRRRKEGWGWVGGWVGGRGKVGALSLRETQMSFPITFLSRFPLAPLRPILPPSLRLPLSLRPSLSLPPSLPPTPSLPPSLPPSPSLIFPHTRPSRPFCLYISLSACPYPPVKRQRLFRCHGLVGKELVSCSCAGRVPSLPPGRPVATPPHRRLPIAG